MAGRGLNKVMIIGNLGGDPEMKYTPQGTAITTFRVAVGRSFKGQDGTQQEETEWFRVVAWTKLAETCNQYLHKGSKVYVEGRLQTRTWKDTNTGQDRYMTELVAQEMQMLDSRPAGSSARASAPGADYEGDDEIPF